MTDASKRERAGKMENGGRPNERNHPPIPPAALDFLPDAAEIEHRPLPGGARWTLYVIVAFFATLFAWSALAELDKVVTARGRLITTAPNLIVQPVATSIVRELLAETGATVHAGDPLVRLDPTFAGADLDQLAVDLNAVRQAIRRLELEAGSGNGDDLDPLERAVLVQRRAEHASRLRTLDEGIARYRAALDSLEERRAASAEQLQLLAEIEAMHATLFKEQHASSLQALEARRQRLAVEATVNDLVNKRVEAEHALARAVAERDGYLDQRARDNAERLSELNRRREGLEEQMKKARMLSDLVVLRAPADGVVLEVGRFPPGAIVREAEAMVTLVPLDSPLELEVEIAAADIGLVRVGDAVRIKFDAFPFQRHGTLDGRVRTVSGDAFAEEGRAGRENLHYRARVGLEQEIEALQGLPPESRLIPGMSVAAEIKVGRRTVLSYFLYPLMKGFDQSLREP
ncbi:HlyD family type I secretion periplasmic adaptor subunit [Endothiovibrio diazotrophicus]